MPHPPNAPAGHGLLRRIEGGLDGVTVRAASPDAGHRLARTAMQAPMSDDQTTPESLLPYEAWTQTALRQVVVRAIAHAAEHGLPGQHHFYITFRTDHPGVVIPPRLRAQYPQEMTIVLQHQFWDLDVGDEAFSVLLSFDKQAERLTIPFAAIRSFADPSVEFALAFAEPAPPPSNETALPALVDKPEKPEAAPAKESGQVVTLDSFRKR